MTPLCTPEITVNPQSDSRTVAPVVCKRWSCPECAKRNRWRVIRESIEGKPKAMLTLTVSSEQHESPAAAAETIKNGLRNLRLSLRRHPRFKDFEFIAIFEKHKSGYPHLHLLIRGSFIPWKWLRKRWEEITGSTHIDIRKIKGTKDAARYVAKYLGKDLTKFEGCKRYWRSHNYSLAQADNDTDDQTPSPWSRYFADPYKLAEFLKKNGWQVSSQPNGTFTYKPPDDDWRGIVQMIWAMECRPDNASHHDSIYPNKT